MRMTGCALQPQFYTMSHGNLIEVCIGHGMSEMRDLLHGSGYHDAGKAAWRQVPAFG
jgi:hypothetical protein